MFNLESLELRHINYDIVVKFKVSSNSTHVSLDKILNFFKID